MNGDNGTSTQAPQMRALLFTDLCDSLILVERIGDAAAAELFQEHDRLVLVLQQQWNGQQIDRSDGLFLLFERAIDALGFALDYQRGLQRLGQARSIMLRARAGLHVGEILTWENSAEAVKVGAKSVEVEGLAKPMAARLMTLARPGQILLSAVAESLTHRATAELGERGKNLLWKSHGRWRFKGVPTSQEVFEVGEVGFAPLRMPRSNAKARRDILLWRQPAALAAETAVLVMLAIGAWAMFRPEPAIAFAERDWVVLGDVSNMTDNALLDDSLQQAFRISLEQSRYVNVLGDLKVRDTLHRMQRKPDMPMDRRTANEVAIREGARAVIMPSVMEVNGSLRVAVEIVDPRTGATVYSEYADGRGVDSALASTDSVVASLRTRLGEAMKDVSRTSAPLPEVATSNLDALHAYAAGLKAYGEYRYPDALAFFEQSARFDPEFAFAYIGQMRVYFARGETIRARQLLKRTLALKAKMAPRDALYLDAWASELNDAGVAVAAHKWKLLGDLYPDYHAAHANRANALFSLGRYGDAEAVARLAAVTQNPMYNVALQMLARTQLAQEELDQALQTYRQVESAGRGQPNREFASVLAARDDFVGASRVLDAIPNDSLPAWFQRTAIAADQGQADEALGNARRARKSCDIEGHVCNALSLQELALRTVSGSAPRGDEFGQALSNMHQQAMAAVGSDRAEWLYMGSAGVYLAQRAGESTVAERWSPVFTRMASELGDPRARQMAELASAEIDRRSGRIDTSIKRLSALVDGAELFQVHVALHMAYLDKGDQASAERERVWLSRHRGLVYAENAGTYSLMALNATDAHSARQQ